MASFGLAAIACVNCAISESKSLPSRIAAFRTRAPALYSFPAFRAPPAAGAIGTIVALGVGFAGGVDCAGLPGWAAIGSASDDATENSKATPANAQTIVSGARAARGRRLVVTMRRTDMPIPNDTWPG